jgi:hypothetical protein
MRNALSLILIQRLWQGLAGLFTVLIVTTTLSLDQQGWYYTFISIAALYSIFEMGLSTAILQMTAQMFVKLHWLVGGRVEGEVSSEFRSFHSASVRVFGLVSIAFLFISFVVGLYVFDHRESLKDVGSVWLYPWIFLIVFTSANMLTLPFLAVLEGSGEIVEVYKVRLIQGFFGAILCWLVLLSGGWLWAAAAMPLSGFLVAGYWIASKRRGLFEMIDLDSRDKSFDWSGRVWPHQWRLGINWVSVFFMSQLATPILFYYCDPVVAGRMGLSLTIVHMLGIVSQSWIARRVPMMSQAVVKREWRILDDLFRKDLTHSLIVFLLGAMGLVICYQLIADTSYVERVLPFWQFVGLLGFVFFYHINGALSAQLRSYRREPLVWIFLIGSLIILIGSILGASSGSVGSVVLVMLSVQALFISPLSFLLWRRYNKILRLEASVL